MATQQIDFSLRIAKEIERQLLVDLLAGVRHYTEPSNYHYIGFGAIHFKDFQLIHRRLAISKMVSIENSEEPKRIKSNKPFDCIDVRIGEALIEIPQFGRSGPTIWWLDFYSGFNENDLKTAAEVAAIAQSGDILMVTCNCRHRAILGTEKSKVQTMTEAEKDGYARDSLQKDIGQNFVPLDVKYSDLFLDSDSYATFQKRVYKSVINDRMAMRADRSLIDAKQICYFRYRDDAPMTTFGWLFSAPSDIDKFDSFVASAKELYKSGDDAIEINPPVLTYREVQHLLTAMPTPVIAPGTCTRSQKERFKEHVEKLGIPYAHALNFAKYYRYFPTYALVHVG